MAWPVGATALSRRRRSRGRRGAAPVLAVAVVLLLAACGGDGESASPSAEPTAFPTAAFADLSEDPVTAATATEFQAALAEAAGGLGATATVISAAGTWSGAVGRADARRAMVPEDQLAIGSITKPVVAAQVLSLVEDGDLALDDPVAEHLPAGLSFDTNDATVRDLLAMRSGIPDPVDEIYQSLSTDPLHRWTVEEVLALVDSERSPPGEDFAYSNTNYGLLGLVVEHVEGRPLAEVLRSDVLAGDGLDRLVMQPDEESSAPRATRYALAPNAFEEGGGYLPTLAAVTAAAGAGAMASDSASLARWFVRLCGAEVVSESTLAEMTTFESDYGLGLESRVVGGLPSVGHGGVQVGFSAWAGCIPDAGVVVGMVNNERIGVAIAIAEALVVAGRD